MTDVHAELEEENSGMKAELKQLKRDKKDLKDSIGASDDERPLKTSCKDKEQPMTTAKLKKRTREDSNNDVDSIPMGLNDPLKRSKEMSPKPRIPSTSVKASRVKNVQPPSPSLPPRSMIPMSDPTPATSDAELKPVTVTKASDAPSKLVQPRQKNLKLNQDPPTSKAEAISSLFHNEEDEEEGVVVSTVGKPVPQRKPKMKKMCLSSPRKNDQPLQSLSWLDLALHILFLQLLPFVTPKRPPSTRTHVTNTLRHLLPLPFMQIT